MPTRGSAGPAGRWCATAAGSTPSRARPPPLRGRLPLLYVGDRLAAVADLWVCEPFAAPPGRLGLHLVRLSRSSALHRS